MTGEYTLPCEPAFSVSETTGHCDHKMTVGQYLLPKDSGNAGGWSGEYLAEVTALLGYLPGTLRRPPRTRRAGSEERMRSTIRRVSLNRSYQRMSPSWLSVGVTSRLPDYQADAVAHFAQPSLVPQVLAFERMT